MKKGLIIIFLAGLLFSCREKAQEKIVIDPEVKCLSAFIFGSRCDTIRNFLFTTYLFKKDTVLVLRPDSLARWNVKAVHLDSADIRTLNKMIKTIAFRSYLHNTMCKQIRESRTIYCGPSYGFIDSNGNVETFIPYEKQKIMDELFTYLRDKKISATNDTVDIMNDMQRIKRKYLKDCPPVPMMDSNASE